MVIGEMQYFSSIFNCDNQSFFLSCIEFTSVMCIFAATWLAVVDVIYILCVLLRLDSQHFSVSLSCVDVPLLFEQDRDPMVMILCFCLNDSNFVSRLRM